MAVTDVKHGTEKANITVNRRVNRRTVRAVSQPPRDLQRTFRLVLATVWLLDAVLQLQPFMFTRGASGFSGMLNGLASGNPAFLHGAVTWNASNVYHQPILTDAIFASIQFLIAFGLIYKRTCKPALVLSIVWALGVWWFGESAGEIFKGGATPFGGGPGGVLFYAILAVLLWPSEGSDRPFVAARTVGVNAAKAIWAVVWGILAILSVVGSGRSPQALHDLVAGLNNGGQPGWLAHIDRSSESLFLHHGTLMAILLAIVCVIVAGGVFLPQPFAQAAVVVAIVVFALIWVAVENFGGILAGGATDPNSGLLVILLASIYWPLATNRTVAGDNKPVSLATARED